MPLGITKSNFMRTDIKYSEIVRAVGDWNAEENCLDLRKDDLIYVQEKAKTGWWFGYLNQTQTSGF